MKKDLQIFWLLDSPSPYNSDLFRIISNSTLFDLNIYYNNLTSKTHFWKDNLNNGLNYKKINFKILINHIFKRNNKKNNNIYIIAGWNYVINILIILLLILSNSKFVFLSDTLNLNKNRSTWKNILLIVIQKIIIKYSYKILTSGKPGVTSYKLIGAPVEKIINVPLWIDNNKYFTKYLDNKLINEDKILQNHFIFTSNGRLINELKGFDIAIEAFGKLVKLFPEYTLEYNIIGDGCDYEKIKQQIKNLKLENIVSLKGWKENDDVINLLCNSHFFIHAATKHEPFGVVIIEAMASGLIVFASDKSMAALDRIDDNYNGFIHKSGDSEMLVTQISSVLKNPRTILDLRNNSLIKSNEWPIEKSIEILYNLF